MRTLDRVLYKKGNKTYNGVVSEQDVELKVENNSISYSNDGVNYNKSFPILQGDTAPTTSTVGQIGQFYLDKTHVNVYQCNGTIQTPPSPPEYQWELMGGRAKQDVLSSAIVADGTIDKSLGFNSLGMLVKGSASGGSLYLHDILIDSYRGRLRIINNSNTSFTLNTLAAYLYNNGYTSTSAYRMETPNFDIVGTDDNIIEWYYAIFGRLSGGTAKARMYYNRYTFSTDGNKVSISKSIPSLTEDLDPQYNEITDKVTQIM